MARFWRVVPWDPDVRRGRPFSPSHVPPATGRGRFDLPTACSPVLYVAESPEHAVAEAVQPWRNRPLRGAHLLRAGRPLALVSVELAAGKAVRLADLRDPGTLARLGVTADRVAARDRRVTRAIAARAWDRGHVGLRWWSAFHGEWCGVVLFTVRAEGSVRFRRPEVLSAETPALRGAAAALGMPLAIRLDRHGPYEGPPIKSAALVISEGPPRR